MKDATPKNFVLQLGALISLYLTITFVLVLLFGLINLLVPDSADSYFSQESAQNSLRLSIAMLLVFFPTFITLTRLVNVVRRQLHDATYLTITKWLLYLSLLAAGLTILIDLVVLIVTFLEGEVTVRFLCKVLAVFTVVGLAFGYYLKDVRGYWVTHENESKLYGLLVSLFVIVTVVFAFFMIDSPESARAIKFDNQKVGHLQDMKWRIEDYYRSNQSLPATITDVYDLFPVPTPPDDTMMYRYEVVDEKFYELCAEFNQASQTIENPTIRPVFEKNYNWEHQAGEWCFQREVDF